MTETKPKSVREYIKEIQNEILKIQDLSPDRASELLVQLSSIYGNILEEIRRTEGIYLGVLRLSLESEEKANRAEIIAKTDPSYNDWQQAKIAEKVCIEMTRGLKHYIRVKEQEYKL